MYLLAKWDLGAQGLNLVKILANLKQDCVYLPWLPEFVKRKTDNLFVKIWM